MTNDLTPVELELEHRPTLGLAAAPPQSFTERLFLGRPKVTELRADDVTPEQRTFLERHPKLRFTKVEAPLSLVHNERDPFEAVWLQITLNANPSEAHVVARSMDPVVLFEPIEMTRTGKIGAALKFVAEYTEQTKVVDRDIYLEALYEGGRTPTWSFSRTEQSIRGRYLLSMVIESDSSAKVVGQPQLGATLRVHRLGIFSYRAKLEPVVEELFRLP